MKTITLTAHDDIIDAIQVFIDGGDSLLCDILCDSYGHEDREEAQELIHEIKWKEE